MLQICDFPFPKDLNPESINHVQLVEIINLRAKFHENILNENQEEIEKFASTYLNLKYAYNLKNKSAFCQALDSKKYGAFYKLKAYRFHDHTIKYTGIKSADDRKNATKFSAAQRRENVSKSEQKEERSISLLSMRSYIYKRHINDATEERYDKINEWYKHIYRTELGSKLIDAVAQCDKLKFIYDFECDSVSFKQI